MEARKAKEERWLQDQDQGETERDESYKQIAKVESSCRIREIYSCPKEEIVGQRLHAICKHILKENIMVSPLNQEYQKTFLGNTGCVFGGWRSQLEERYKMKTGSWKEDDDDSLSSRCDLLVEKGLCEDRNELANLIDSQTGSGKNKKPKVKGRGGKDPTARNVVGLYLGIELPHRTAYECSQRLVHLVKGVSVLSKGNQAQSAEKRKAKEEHSTPRKQKMMWTHNEDRNLIELVLRKKTGGFKTVEEVDSRPEGSKSVLKIPWEKFSEEFEDRRWSDLRDRWQNHLKPVLLQPDLWETAEALWELDVNLLAAVAETGATSLREVPWDQVKQRMGDCLLSFLKNRLRGLLRQQKGDLKQQVDQALRNLRLGKSLSGSSARSGLRETKMKKTQENNHDLLIFYRDLISSD